MSTHNNNSRFYYVSNENMSDIKESIDEYSMNFEKESGVHRNSKSEIAEMISGSHQVTQSKGFTKDRNKENAKQGQTVQYVSSDIKQQIHHGNQQNQQTGGADKKPINLGDKVYNIIKQRYSETNKITTEDPQVLYNFYLVQRRQLPVMRQISDSQIQKQMPSMQRKLIVKRQFMKILAYYPDDVYYSLCCEAEKIKKDRQLQQKLEYFNRGQSQNKKKATQHEINGIVEKLYNHKGQFGPKAVQLQPDQIHKLKRMQFGRNLSEHFQNTQRNKPPAESIETVDRLYKFWQNIYQRQQYKIDWPQQTAKQAIQQYMYEQIQDLMSYANRKLGFKCGKAMTLFQFYGKNYHKIENIHIPLNCFQEYVKVYNQVERRKVIQDSQKVKKEKEQHERAKKVAEVKKFGRPVSATPISVLAKAKDHTSPIEHLAQKYPNDKLIKTLVTEQQLKKPRYPFEYGVFDLAQEVKLKQWVKIDPKKHTKFEDVITDKLIKTFTNEQFRNVHHTGPVLSLLEQQNIEKKQVWKELGPTLHEAMLVQAHEDHWFRDAVVRYLLKFNKQGKYDLQTNQFNINKLFSILNNADEMDRGNYLQKLHTVIQTSLQIEQKSQQIKKFTDKSPNDNQSNREKRLLYARLQDKAIQYVKMRIRNTNPKFVLRNYLKQLYQQVSKEHKTLVKKIFNVVEGDKQCPKLLKYEFFRIVKQINPITLQRQKIQKTCAWIPPKQTPESFNYKTFNAFSQFYTKDRNIIVAEPEKQKYKGSIWGRKKSKDRENLMMTYDDAKNCMFQPKYSKKI